MGRRIALNRQSRKEPKSFDERVRERLPPRGFNLLELRLNLRPRLSGGGGAGTKGDGTAAPTTPKGSRAGKGQGTTGTPTKVEAKNAALKKHVQALETKLGALKNCGLASKGRRGTKGTPPGGGEQHLLALTDGSAEEKLPKRRHGGKDGKANGKEAAKKEPPPCWFHKSAGGVLAKRGLPLQTRVTGGGGGLVSA